MAARSTATWYMLFTLALVSGRLTKSGQSKREAMSLSRSDRALPGGGVAAGDENRPREGRALSAIRAYLSMMIRPFQVPLPIFTTKGLSEPATAVDSSGPESQELLVPLVQPDDRA